MDNELIYTIYYIRETVLKKVKTSPMKHIPSKTGNVESFQE